jgi:hypothetical protein
MSLNEYQGVERRREIGERAVTPTPIQLVVHCIAQHKKGQWQAFSLEFGLAAQGESLQDVKRRLDSMVHSYVFDALGEDRSHALQLLRRKATWDVYVKYYLADVISRTKRIWGATNETIAFSEPLHLAPVCTVN